MGVVFGRLSSKQQAIERAHSEPGAVKSLYWLKVGTQNEGRPRGAVGLQHYSWVVCSRYTAAMVYHDVHQHLPGSNVGLECAGTISLALTFYPSSSDPGPVPSDP